MPDGPRELRLVVTAPDYDEALRFYRDVLGLREQATFSSDGSHVTILHAGRATLELAEPAYAAYIDEVEVGRRVAGQVRVGFEVADVVATTDDLVEAGATLVADPVRTPWGSLNARLDGPAGLHLTIFSPEVHLAPPTRVDGAVLLVEPDPAWPVAARDLIASAWEALGDRARLLQHVGSTSVPGLVAKPLIDLVLTVQDPADEDSYVPALTALGYELRIREPDWHEHRLLKLRDPEVNLHVFAVGSEEVDRMLAFRDHLRADDRDRALYETAKRELAVRAWAVVQDYADAKSEVVADIMGRALARRVPLEGVFVVVSGPPGDGRTALARGLAARLGLPLLASDPIQRALTDDLGVSDIDTTRRIGRAAVSALLALAGQSGSAVLEGPWDGIDPVEPAGLPGQVVEVVHEPGRPVTSEVDRLARSVRQAAAGASPRSGPR